MVCPKPLDAEALFWPPLLCHGWINREWCGKQFQEVAMNARMLAAIRFTIVALSGVLAGHLHAQAPYYQGKTIRLIQGREGGGSGDIRSRAVIPFLKKHIPGNPNIVSEFMPGGGGRKAANHIFNSARPDGLTIGHVSSGIVTSAVLGETGIQYDLNKFHWLGSTDSAFHYAFFIRKDLGLNNLEKVRAYSGLKIGATSIGHTTYTYGRTFAWLLGLKETKFVLGYSSIEIDTAIARGELDARSNNTAETLRRNPDAVKKALFDFVAILKIPREDKEPEFDHLPELDTFAKSEGERRFLSLMRSTRAVGTPYIMPPNTPKEQVQILREGIKKTFQDPEFRKEFVKLTGDTPSPMMPEAQEEIVKSIPRDAETIALFNTINGNKPLPPR
jgi:tripartite-type tricarboxylate transporter receptor subunit TctC